MRMGVILMGRQIQIHATMNDIQSLVENVQQTYPDLCRIDFDSQSLQLKIFPCDQLSENPTWYMTTKDIVTDVKNKVMKAEMDYSRDHPGKHYFYVSDYRHQCVEIYGGFCIKNDQAIYGNVINFSGRIYVYDDRMKSIDDLYSQFVKQTRKMAVKYRNKDHKGWPVYYTFPEADGFIKDYLQKKERGEPHNYNIRTPDDFPEQYILG